MIASLSCKAAVEQLGTYAENTLAPAEAAAVEEHLEHCDACRDVLRRVKAMTGLLQYAGARTAHDAPPEAAHRTTFLGRAPWWAVSCALHVLIIALAGLITMAVNPPLIEDGVVMVTELQPPPSAEPPKEDTKDKPVDVLDSRHDTPATDPNSKESSDIVVPPDILAKAQLGDHFETINPDMPDTHSALGNPDARSFHSVEGNTEPAGGGGAGGMGMEDLIGVAGVASAGSGGGFGGGDGSGIGSGQGSGKGSFGNRNGGGRRLMVAAHGGSAATESAVNRGLEWLARHQSPDGHWDAKKFGVTHKEVLERFGQQTVDCSATSLALLAFLGAGNTEKIGKYKENVVRGLKWLKTIQEYDSGLYCKWNYGHAMAGMAMAEAAGMARIPDTIESAQKAVDATCALAKNYPTSDRGGWSYYPEQFSACVGDMSNSGWAMMFLKSAKVANLKIPHESLQGVKAYLDACQREKAPGDDYDGHKYSYAPHRKDDLNRGYIAILGRLFFGTPANEVENGVRYMLDVYKFPAPTKAQNLYYDYYMTLITFQVGGNMWKEWNAALKDAFPPNQVKGGDDDGSWEPVGPYSDCWGRVGQTALSCLCMEVYYRYAKLTPGK